MRKSCILAVLGVIVASFSVGCGDAKKIAAGRSNDERSNDGKSKLDRFAVVDGAVPGQDQSTATQQSSSTVTSTSTTTVPNPDTRASLCRLPTSAMQLLGWGDVSNSPNMPITSVGHKPGTGILPVSPQMTEVVALCEFKEPFVICAMGVEPTTDAQSILGCEPLVGVNDVFTCQSTVKAKLAANTDKKISGFFCVPNKKS